MSSYQSEGHLGHNLMQRTGPGEIKWDNNRNLGVVFFNHGSETNRIALVQVVDGGILECTSVLYPPNNARDRLFVVSCPATKQGIVLLFENYQESNLRQLATILETHVQGNNVTYVGSDMFSIETLWVAGINDKTLVTALKN